MTKPKPKPDVPAEPAPEYLDDAQIAAELSELARQDEELRRMRRRFKADAHRDIDRSVEAAKQRVTETLAAHVYHIAHAGGTAVIPIGLADAWVLASQPAIAEEWHRQVDAATAGPMAGAVFGPMDRPEWEAARKEINERSGELGREQALRAATRNKEQAERELADLGVNR